jgi:lysophospholipase L1-like esterase
MTLRRPDVLLLTLCALLLGGRLPVSAVAADEPLLDLHEGDKVVLIGNTLAERMQNFGYWETLLHSRFPQLQLVVRNLGWSADTITLRLRSKDFQDHGHTLIDHQPNAILAFFGYNESFAGPEGVEQFKTDLATFIGDVQQLKYPATTFERNKEDEPITLDDTGEVQTTPTLVLISPTANENVPSRGIMAADANNDNLRIYTQAMREVAAVQNVAFVDLFTPTFEIMGNIDDPLTINGVHLTERGYIRLAPILDAALFGPRPKEGLVGSQIERLREAVNEKNLQHWYDYRAVNGYYIYGGRKEPFGVVNFPAEFAKLRKMVAVRDQRVWDVAQGKEVPEEIDDSETGAFTKIETNFENEVHITSPEEALSRFSLPQGFEIQLVASEQDFPDLENPVQLAFDARGRLWVTTIGSYPMYLPGTPVDDKVLIFEDVDGDGKADKQTVFADKLHIPMGIELGYGGVFVSQQPNLLFLEDTDGDDQADKREIILHGFDSADSHHAISAFEWGPGGELYFQEGTFHHS